MADLAGYWDDEAEHFDDEADHGLHDPAVRAAWRELLVSVMPPPPVRVADLGCGTGSLSALLAYEGHLVTGVDRSPRMIERAGRKTASIEPRPRFVVADAAAPPLARGTFGVALCRHVLWALPDPAAALERWMGLVVPGGSLVLVEGRWGTGAGLRSDQVVPLVGRLGSVVEVRPLPDPVLWGKPIDDERYLVVARPAST